jgi:hypothetical protein
VTAQAGLARRAPLRDDDIPKAALVGDRAFIERVVAGLRESLAVDLIALSHVEDDIDAALGEQPPAPHQITPLSLRLRSAVAQLVDIAMRETDGRPQGDAATAVLRGCRALAEALPTEPLGGLGHLRRVALAAQDFLDQGVVKEDVLDRAALLVEGNEV